MKLGIFVGIILGIVIVGAAVIAILVFNVLPINRQVSINVTSTPFAAPPVSASVPTSIPPTPTLSSSSHPTALTPTDVNFSLNITNINRSGLSSVVVTAQVTNTGTTDAHNVKAKVQVLSQGNQIQVSGLETPIILGTLKAGETITVQQPLSFNIPDGLKIMSNGATFKLTISSDEKTQTFSYDYHPV